MATAKLGRDIPRRAETRRDLIARSLAAALLLAFSLPAFSAPAPWHVWLSTLDGQRLCAQGVPGPGWKKLKGPYQDSRCEKPGKPGQWVVTPAK